MAEGLSAGTEGVLSKSPNTAYVSKPNIRKGIHWPIQTAQVDDLADQEVEIDTLGAATVTGIVAPTAE